MVYLGETVRMIATLVDEDAAALTPDTQSIGLYKANGTLQGELVTNPTLVTAGQYRQDFTIPSDGVAGTWSIVWTVVKASKTAIGVYRITVEATV